MKNRTYTDKQRRLFTEAGIFFLLAFAIGVVTGNLIPSLAFLPLAIVFISLGATKR